MMIKLCCQVANLNSVETAAVPIITFDFRGVNIDLLFARLNENSISEKINIFDDKILKQIDDNDEGTEKSLNGPRVTYMIQEFVKPMYDNFLIVLRCVRKWAKIKGLYGNKLGYLGGVNFNILVAFVCQLYPNASPSYLLSRFFRVYNQWDWPQPILLNHIQASVNDGADKWDVWTREKYPYHVMPIITPAFPAMNSSMSVSSHTLRVIQEEIKKGHEALRPVINKQISSIRWESLFAPSDFFLKYSYYFQCNMVGIKELDPKGGVNSTTYLNQLDGLSQSWKGYVESRLRKFPDMLMKKLPLDVIHLFPVKYACTSQTPLDADDNYTMSECYFIGFEVDKTKLRDDKTIHVERCAAEFRSEMWHAFSKGQRDLYGIEVSETHGELDFTVDVIPWRKLPPEVLVSQGGKETVKRLRSEMKGHVTAVGTTPNRGKVVAGGDASTESAAIGTVAVTQMDVVTDDGQKDRVENGGTAVDVSRTADGWDVKKDSGDADGKSESALKLFSAIKRKRKNSETDISSSVNSVLFMSPSLQKQNSGLASRSGTAANFYTTAEKNTDVANIHFISSSETNRTHRLPPVTWDLLDVR